MSNTMRELKIDEVESVSSGVIGAVPGQGSAKFPSGLFAKGYFELLLPNGEWAWFNSY
jgi:hypothetical protein